MSPATPSFFGTLRLEDPHSFNEVIARANRTSEEIEKAAQESNLAEISHFPGFLPHFNSTLYNLRGSFLHVFFMC
jgi:hypothetical protein